MTPSEELQATLDKIEKVVDVEFIKFYGALVAATPVDIGHLKGDWFQTKVKWTNSYYHLVTNNMEYAPSIWAGIRTVNGRSYGSHQGWGQEGGQVFVDKQEKILQRALDAI